VVLTRFTPRWLTQLNCALFPFHHTQDQQIRDRTAVSFSFTKQPFSGLAFGVGSISTVQPAGQVSSPRPRPRTPLTVRAPRDLRSYRVRQAYYPATAYQTVQIPEKQTAGGSGAARVWTYAIGWAPMHVPRADGCAALVPAGRGRLLKAVYDYTGRSRLLEAGG